MTRTTIQAAFIFPSILLLGACGALPDRDNIVYNRDSAPAHSVDIASIPNAEPRIVPYSRYGNPTSYVVNGRRYKVMANSSNFQQQGTASWYGTKFHGRKTSSGEPYDMFAMTAAHKSLPLPTWVEVTNKKNNKRIIVKVNDRGPFVDDRILDLSFAAATKLGVVATGTAPVTIRAIDPAQYLADKKRGGQPGTSSIASTRGLAPSPAGTIIKATTSNLTTTQESVLTSPAPTAVIAAAPQQTVAAQPPTTTPAVATSNKLPAPIGGFYLQIAAFSDRDNAEQLRLKLQPLKPGDIQVNPDNQSGNDLYRVRIGPLSSLSEAGRVAAQVTMLGLGEPKIMLD